MENIARFAANRLIKVFANLIKILCYGFHFLFPNKRFTIPEHAAPMVTTHANPVIPRILWQTNYTNRVTLPVYINYLFNRLLSPTYEYRFMITEARALLFSPAFLRIYFKIIQRSRLGLLKLICGDCWFCGSLGGCIWI